MTPQIGVWYVYVVLDGSRLTVMTLGQIAIDRGPMHSPAPRPHTAGRVGMRAML